MELAQHNIIYQTLDNQYEVLEEKKGDEEILPKRGRHLVEADATARMQMAWVRDH